MAGWLHALNTLRQTDDGQASLMLDQWNAALNSELRRSGCLGDRVQVSLEETRPCSTRPRPDDSEELRAALHRRTHGQQASRTSMAMCGGASMAFSQQEKSHLSSYLLNTENLRMALQQCRPGNTEHRMPRDVFDVSKTFVRILRHNHMNCLDGSGYMAIDDWKRVQQIRSGRAFNPGYQAILRAILQGDDSRVQIHFVISSDHPRGAAVTYLDLRHVRIYLKASQGHSNGHSGVDSNVQLNADSWNQVNEYLKSTFGLSLNQITPVHATSRWAAADISRYGLMPGRCIYGGEGRSDIHMALSIDSHGLHREKEIFVFVDFYRLWLEKISVDAIKLGFTASGNVVCNLTIEPRFLTIVDMLDGCYFGTDTPVSDPRYAAAVQSEVENRRLRPPVQRSRGRGNASRARRSHVQYHSSRTRRSGGRSSSRTDAADASVPKAPPPPLPDDAHARIAQCVSRLAQVNERGQVASGIIRIPQEVHRQIRGRDARSLADESINRATAMVDAITIDDSDDEDPNATGLEQSVAARRRRDQTLLVLQQLERMIANDPTIPLQVRQQVDQIRSQVNPFTLDDTGNRLQRASSLGPRILDRVVTIESEGLLRHPERVEDLSTNLARSQSCEPSLAERYNITSASDIWPPPCGPRRPRADSPATRDVRPKTTSPTPSGTMGTQTEPPRRPPSVPVVTQSVQTVPSPRPSSDPKAGQYNAPVTVMPNGELMKQPPPHSPRPPGPPRTVEMKSPPAQPDGTKAPSPRPSSRTTEQPGLETQSIAPSDVSHSPEPKAAVHGKNESVQSALPRVTYNPKHRGPHYREGEQVCEYCAQFANVPYHDCYFCGARPSYHHGKCCISPRNPANYSKARSEQSNASSSAVVTSNDFVPGTLDLHTQSSRNEVRREDTSRPKAPVSKYRGAPPMEPPPPRRPPSSRSVRDSQGDVVPPRPTCPVPSSSDVRADPKSTSYQPNINPIRVDIPVQPPGPPQNVQSSAGTGKSAPVLPPPGLSDITPVPQRPYFRPTGENIHLVLRMQGRTTLPEPKPKPEPPSKAAGYVGSGDLPPLWPAPGYVPPIEPDATGRYRRCAGTSQSEIAKVAGDSINPLTGEKWNACIFHTDRDADLPHSHCKDGYNKVCRCILDVMHMPDVRRKFVTIDNVLTSVQHESMVYWQEPIELGAVGQQAIITDDDPLCREIQQRCGTMENVPWKELSGYAMSKMSALYSGDHHQPCTQHHPSDYWVQRKTSGRGKPTSTYNWRYWSPRRHLRDWRDVELYFQLLWSEDGTVQKIFARTTYDLQSTQDLKSWFSDYVQSLYAKWHRFLRPKAKYKAILNNWFKFFVCQVLANVIPQLRELFPNMYTWAPKHHGDIVEHLIFHLFRTGRFEGLEWILACYVTWLYTPQGGPNNSIYGPSDWEFQPEDSEPDHSTLPSTWSLSPSSRTSANRNGRASIADAEEIVQINDLTNVVTLNLENLQDHNRQHMPPPTAESFLDQLIEQAPFFSFLSDQGEMRTRFLSQIERDNAHFLQLLEAHRAIETGLGHADLQNRREHVSDDPDDPLGGDHIERMSTLSTLSHSTAGRTNSTRFNQTKKNAHFKVNMSATAFSIACITKEPHADALVDYLTVNATTFSILTDVQYNKTARSGDWQQFLGILESKYISAKLVGNVLFLHRANTADCMIETECTVVYHKPLNEIKAIIVKYQLPCTLNSDVNHTPISMTNITTRLASGEIAVDQYTPVEYGGQNSFSIAYVQDLHEQWALNSHEWYQDTHESAMTLSEYEEKCYQESIIALFEFLVLCYNKNVDILYCEGRAFTTKGPNGKLDIGTFAGCYLDKACLSVIDQASANGVWQNRVNYTPVWQHLTERMRQAAIKKCDDSKTAFVESEYVKADWLEADQTALIVFHRNSSRYSMKRRQYVIDALFTRSQEITYEKRIQHLQVSAPSTGVYASIAHETAFFKRAYEALWYDPDIVPFDMVEDKDFYKCPYTLEQYQENEGLDVQRGQPYRPLDFDIRPTVGVMAFTAAKFFGDVEQDPRFPYDEFWRRPVSCFIDLYAQKSVTDRSAQGFFARAHAANRRRRRNRNNNGASSSNILPTTEGVNPIMEDTVYVPAQPRQNDRSRSRNH